MYSIALYQLWNFIAKLNGYFYSSLNMLLVFLHAIFGNGWIEGLKSQEQKIIIIQPKFMLCLNRGIHIFVSIQWYCLRWINEFKIEPNSIHFQRMILELINLHKNQTEIQEFDFIVDHFRSPIRVLNPSIENHCGTTALNDKFFKKNELGGIH